MAERPLILRIDESIPLSNKMDQEIASVSNRALFHPKALAHIRSMDGKMNAKGAITAITHANGTAEMALHYRDIMIKTAWTVDQGVVDVKVNESWKRLKINTVPLIWYIGKGTEVLQKMREEL
jgi:hypothetical protein